jgi:hypothetical protein
LDELLEEWWRRVLCKLQGYSIELLVWGCFVPTWCFYPSDGNIVLRGLVLLNVSLLLFQDILLIEQVSQPYICTIPDKKNKPIFTITCIFEGKMVSKNLWLVRNSNKRKNQTWVLKQKPKT